MLVEYGSRPRPIGRPNLSPDGVGGSGGNGEQPGRPISLISELAGWEKGRLGEHPQRRMWAAIKDATSMINAYGDAASFDAAWRVKWAYRALVNPYADEPRKAVIGIPAEYTQLREEQVARGEDMPGIELTRFTQVKTLQWVLDQAEVPITLGNTPICILLSPFEQAAQATDLASRRYYRQAKNIHAEQQPGTQDRQTIDFESERRKRRPQG